MSKSLRFALIGAGLLILASCKSGMDMSKDYYTVTPEVLEAVGGEVPYTVTGTFPAKFFPKKVVCTATPELRWEGGSVKGEPITLQGEKVQGNNKVVSYKEGGTFTYNGNFKYQPEMEKSELYITFDANKNGKAIEIAPVKIADGVISTAELYAETAQAANTAASTDSYQRIIKQAQDANIMFVIQQANVRSSETNSDAVKALKEAMKNYAADTKNYAIDNIEVSAYASPDGGVKLNDKLAAQREKNAASYVKNEVKKAKVNTEIDSKYTAQDWEGFKELVEKSNLQDKDVILRVLSMYSDPEKREAEIKNLSAVYKDLAADILPQLRRARLTLNYQIIGRSDDEIKEAYKSNASVLSVDELLYAATLTEDKAQKKAIYTTASKNYPNDYRAFNNLGELAFKDGDLATAESNFKKALALNPSAPEVNTNMGLLCLAQNKPADAQTYFAKGGQSKANQEALGNLYIAQGQYERALTALKGSNTNAEALAMIMSKDYAGAKRVLAAVKDANAQTAYLSAVVAARTNDAAAVAQNLKKAVSLDSSLKAKAQKDLEFAKYQDAINAL
ncbi:MAG: tetratricopeptide repeat protein [Bacteroidaceae bacterium]|nr:tetratricopeptide repeat protein [Bacteroidaceae bacterium]